MSTAGIAEFTGEQQSDEQHWRSIVLFGRNVASYKFALAKSLLEIGRNGKEFITLDDLAVPFARHICEHLANVDRQGTFAHSRFLDACRFFNAGRINIDEIRTATSLLGFVNVIDAFHVVGTTEVPTRFFMDERATSNGIRLTDELLSMATASTATDLTLEAEARWRLVEEAWDAKADGKQTIVLYDAPRQLLVPALLGKRRSITEVRPALNGYQKGHCFYCFRPIGITKHDTAEIADIDHFFPHTLMSRGLPLDLDAPWNLVLACTTCNRGPSGKFASLPHSRYLTRLHRRNEFLINSNHPLKETLILTTGNNTRTRASFLKNVMQDSTPLAATNSGWATSKQAEAQF